MVILQVNDAKLVDGHGYFNGNFNIINYYN